MIAAVDIAEYLDASTPVPELGVDVIFVPGTRLSEPARLAADLLARQIAPIAVLTGGINRVSGLGESREHYRLMRDMGIGDDRLIVEDRSSNTLENVTMALPLVQARCPRITRVLAVTKWMHSRRVLMTLKRNWPEGIRYYAQSYAPDGVTKQNWMTSTSAGVVRHNWDCIPEYVAAGHLEEIIFDDDAYI